MEKPITFNAFADDPTMLFERGQEQPQQDRFDTIAASLGDLTMSELVIA